MTQSFLERLAHSKPLLLDGAMGTEIDRRGVPTLLPLWSAGALDSHPEIVREIHVDYLHAGSDIITTNTFRTHAHNIGDQGKARQMTLLAAELAHEALQFADRHAFVAGSIAPLEDCYSPHLVPAEAVCLREHEHMVRNLIDGGVDLLLIETMNTIYEARAAAFAAHAAGIPFIVSYVLGDDGNLLSGESLGAATDTILPLKPAAFMLNCIPPHQIVKSLQELKQLVELPTGAYGNMGKVDDLRGWEPDVDLSPTIYCDHVAVWLAAGCKIVGSCCGSTPAHIAAIRTFINQRETQS